MNKIIGITIIVVVMLFLTVIGPLIAGNSFKEVFIVNLLTYMLVGLIYAGVWLAVNG